MDETAILKAGRKPLADEIKKVIALLPVSGSPPDKAVITKTLGHLNRLGLQIASIYSPTVIKDMADPSVNILTIYSNGLITDRGMIPEYYQDPEQLQRYTDTAAMMFQTILGDEDAANRAQPLTPKDVKKEWADAAKVVVDFELQLADIINSQSESPDDYDSPRTIEQLSALTPSVDWSLLLKETLPAGVNYTRPVVVNSLPYLTGVDALLQKAAATTLQHYFSWVLIQNHADNLAGPYKQPWVAFNTVVRRSPAIAKVARWETCVALVNNNLNHLSGHYFIRETFKGNSRKEVMTIIDNISSAYGETFNTAAWLDKPSRDGAIKKLKGIVKAIGYSIHDPDDTSSKSLDAYYKNYPIAANDYFGNQLNYSVWLAAHSFALVNLPVNREEMFELVTRANGSNSPFYNLINIPAGILQDPVFNLENPEYVNYGSMGLIGSHELGVNHVGNIFL